MKKINLSFSKLMIVDDTAPDEISKKKYIGEENDDALLKD